MKSALLLVTAAGCISIPSKQQPACTMDSDCGTGEVCDEGVCWGNPPMGMFAATLVPPSDRADVVQTQMPTLLIPGDGWLGDVALEAPVTFSGRVEAYCPGGTTSCTTSSLPATITVTRAPRFAGGPSFHAVADAKDGIARGSTSFSLGVPITHDGDADYVVTVTPDGRGAQPPTNGTISPAELAPPLRMSLHAAGDLPAATITLGAADAQVISGSLTDGNGHALQNYRVVAMGRWDPAEAPLEVSTVDYTANGTFSITLSAGITGNVEIVATPYDTNVVMPTLHLPNLAPLSTQKLLASPASLGNLKTESIKIMGVSGSGEIAAVAGARVIVRAEYSPMLAGGTSAELDQEATTDDTGVATLKLLDGSAFASGYTLSVIAPVGSNLRIAYNQPWTFGQNDPLCGTPSCTGDSCSCIGLSSRVAVRGTLLDTAGHPIAGANVTARPSLRFQWSLGGGEQDFLSQIPAPTGVTTNSGDFVVWVDPFIAMTWGTYDLDVEPASGDDVPSWTIANIDIPRDASQTTLTLGPVMVPDAANIHGYLVDPAQNPVDGGELRVFSLAADTSTCDQSPYHPTPCVIPAPLVGHGTSDMSGTVRLTLPRP